MQRSPSDCGPFWITWLLSVGTSFNQGFNQSWFEWKRLFWAIKKWRQGHKEYFMRVEDKDLIWRSDVGFHHSAPYPASQADDWHGVAIWSWLNWPKLSNLGEFSSFPSVHQGPSQISVHQNPPTSTKVHQGPRLLPESTGSSFRIKISDNVTCQELNQDSAFLLNFWCLSLSFPGIPPYLCKSSRSSWFFQIPSQEYVNPTSFPTSWSKSSSTTVRQLLSNTWHPSLSTTSNVSGILLSQKDILNPMT